MIAGQVARPNSTCRALAGDALGAVFALCHLTKSQKPLFQSRRRRRRRGSGRRTLNALSLFNICLPFSLLCAAYATRALFCLIALIGRLLGLFGGIFFCLSNMLHYFQFELWLLYSLCRLGKSNNGALRIHNLSCIISIWWVFNRRVRALFNGFIDLTHIGVEKIDITPNTSLYHRPGKQLCIAVKSNKLMMSLLWNIYAAY